MTDWDRAKAIKDINKRRNKIGGTKQNIKEDGAIKGDRFHTPNTRRKRNWMPHIEKGAPAASGKGDQRRTSYITDEEYRDRHDLAFGNITEKEFKRRENARRKSSNS